MPDKTGLLRLFVVTALMALPGCRTFDHTLQRAGIPCGAYRWPVKTLTDPDANAIRLKPIDTTIRSLVTLSRPAGPEQKRRRGIEFYVYRVRAVLVEVHSELDQDLHLRLRDPGDPEIQMIAEIPDPRCATGSQYESAFASARKVAESIRGKGGGTLVQVSGVGFFDALRDQTGGAPNGLELHPVLELSEIPPVRR